MMDIDEKNLRLVFDPDSDNAELLAELRRRHRRRGFDGAVEVDELLDAHERDRAIFRARGTTPAFESARSALHGRKGGQRPKRLKRIFAAVAELVSEEPTLTTEEVYRRLRDDGRMSSSDPFGVYVQDERVRQERPEGSISRRTLERYVRDAKKLRVRGPKSS